MYMCMSVLAPTCTVSAPQFFFFFSSGLLNRMRARDEKHRNKNVWPELQVDVKMVDKSPLGEITSSFTRYTSTFRRIADEASTAVL